MEEDFFVKDGETLEMGWRRIPSSAPALWTDNFISQEAREREREVELITSS